IIRGYSSNQDTQCHFQSNREDADEERDLSAIDDAEEHVAPDTIRAEPVLTRRASQTIDKIGAVGLGFRDNNGAADDEQEEQNDTDRACQCHAVLAETSPDQLTGSQ